MPWTPLHAALGETSSDLTFEMMEKAVEQRVEETANLDWKAKLPLSADKPSGQPQRDRERYELAKDIAAMANSGGGMIVYGIGETTIEGRTAAGGFTGDVAVTSDDRKRIHQVAFSAIHPPVTGLDLIHMHPEDHPDGGVLVTLVPDSPDTPHLVVQKGDGGFFQAPWRSGPETFFMTERQLADAYRRREQSRRDHGADLDDVHDRFLGSVGATAGPPVWVFAVARPLRPLNDPRAMTQGAAERVLAVAANAPWARSVMTAVTEVRQQAMTRRGLRMFHWTSSREAYGREIRARVEVHGDGSLAVGITRDGFLHPNDKQHGNVPVDDIEKTGLDLVALLLGLRKIGGPISDYDVCIDVSPGSSLYRRPDSALGGLYEPFDENHRVPDFRAVRGTVIGQFGRVELLDSAVDIISDAMNQAGVNCWLRGESLERDLQMDEI